MKPKLVILMLMALGSICVLRALTTMSDNLLVAGALILGSGVIILTVMYIYAIFKHGRAPLDTREFFF